MKRIQYGTLLLVALALGTVSCSDFLDRTPVGNAVDENFWNSQDDAEVAVNGAYALLRTAMFNCNGYYAYGVIPSDELNELWHEADYLWIQGYQLNSFIPESETHRSLANLRNYKYFYRVVNYANKILAKIPEIPADKFQSEEVRGRLTGEAYFLRAFSYFTMTRIWGDVPKVTEVTDDLMSTPYVARAPMEEIYRLIDEDLEEAVKYLKWDNLRSSHRTVRANRGAAYTLQAHFYAWIGDYARCAEAAEALTGSAEAIYSLVDGENIRWIFDEGGTTENIFELAQRSEDSEASLETFFHFLLRRPFVNRDIAFFNLNQARLSELYAGDTDDVRYAEFIYDHQDERPFCAKYKRVCHRDNTSGQYYIDNNMVIFRLADILLLQAEAYSLLPGRESEAADILTQIRTRAGLGPYTPTGNLTEDVFEERARELFCEGHRFYDMIRLYKVKGINKFLPYRMSDEDLDNGKYYWPLDPVLLKYTDVVKQTPYWTGKM